MNKTALVTGASKRIGKSIAEHLASKGWDVVIHFNRSEEPAKKLETLLRQKYPQQEFSRIQANLESEKEVEGLVLQVVSATGPFDLLVNNASVFLPGYLKDTTTGLFDSQMNTNFKAPFLLMRDFALHCKKGNIVNFVDTRITTSKSNFAAYSLSKKALWELTKMAALEFAPDIRINAIAPGVSLPPEDKSEQYLWGLAENIPMKKPGGVVPILKSIDYILENDHLTGQLLFTDGGENLGQND